MGRQRAAKDALFDGFATIARALAAGRRAEIVDVLAQGERSVEQVAEAIEQSVANTSHHLRTLARAGLVTTRRQGTHVFYRLASDRVLDLWLSLRSVAAEQLEGMEQLTRGYLGDGDDVEAIGADELRALLERGEVVLIDARPEAEYRAGHLPGAVSVPPDRLDLLDSLPPDGEVVAYCRGPYCVYADDALRRLLAAGRPGRRLREGVPEWQRTGGVVER